MARGSKPGERRGGRVKGTPNKATQDVQAKLAAIGCDPFEGMAKLASGEVPCLMCRESGHLPSGDPCPKCLGTGAEVVPVEVRGRMHSELAQYVAPKRKAVEMSGPNGGAVQVEDVSRPPRQTRDTWLALREKELGGMGAATRPATRGD